MTANDILIHRLLNQQLTGTKFRQAGELVDHFGAMQAQDYAMVKWAVGLRMGKTEHDIEQAISSGEIVRTHVLRPTWHLVAAKDVRWMLELSAQRIRGAFAAMSRQLEMDAKFYARCNKIIEREVAGKQLTREEIMKTLGKKKIPTNELRSVFIMMNAELDGIVCNGVMRGKQLTYALLDEKIPPAKKITRQEALAALAKRYFTSHGPATLHDFSWWSGLSVADAKAGISFVADELESITLDNQTYWFKDCNIPTRVKQKSIYFLPAFDEFMVSYKDRSLSLELSRTKDAITNNGIFKPVIIIDGKVMGLWKRTVKKDTAEVEIQYFSSIKSAQLKAMQAAGRKYGDYIGKKIVFV